MKLNRVENLKSVAYKKLKAALVFFYEKQIAQWTKMTIFYTDSNTPSERDNTPCQHVNFCLKVFCWIVRGKKITGVRW